MDEASVCGPTSGVRLQDGALRSFFFRPEECGLQSHPPETLMPDRDRSTAAVKMYRLLAGRGDSARLDAIILNSALIFLVRGIVATVTEGVGKAREILFSGQALATLARWVEVQNSDPAGGLTRLASLARAAG
jgi:anthranilate phosphoribosyltransferase